MEWLYDYQWDAMNRMKNGCILCGGVGSGKSRTALAYYFVREGNGRLTRGGMEPMRTPLSLYIITTARKRDTLEWDQEMTPFHLSQNPSDCQYGDISVVVDSWNNVAKYKRVMGAFFIFDEQRVVGSGAWVKAFLHIARQNRWILLSATPGDNWADYIPVFIANGFYRNRTEFKDQHMVISYKHNFPIVERYIGLGQLQRQRDDILVGMDFERRTTRKIDTVLCDYDKELYRTVAVGRWNPYSNMPIQNISEYCMLLRRVVNSDPSRLAEVERITAEQKRVIIFYTFDYEREALMNGKYAPGTVIAEWNGHNHQDVPDTERWVYLVQYASGSEAWNCIQTDSMIFYSQTYSYKTLEQAMGRIDRMNTPFLVLHYYQLRSMAPIDLAIAGDIRRKRKFNESRYAGAIRFDVAENSR